MKRLNSFLDNHLVAIVTTIAFGLFMRIFIFYFTQNATLFYGDAKARLLLARRVFDSLTPGLTQLGSVWPPLPQILFLPTVWNDFFFYSGLSGSLISILSATVATYFLAKMVLEMSKSKFVTIVTALAFVLNPSFLYISTTPMTESLFIFLIIVATYFTWKWSVTDNIVYLPLAGIATVATTLTRYDGWFFAAFLAIVISVIVFLKRKSFSETEGTFLVFSTVAFSGIVAWLIYNQLIYGDMFRFAVGEGSALSQAVGGTSVKLSKGNIINSSLIYLSASVLNVGIVSLSVTFLASILAIIRRNYNFLLAILLLSTPLWFNILSLFLGQSELITGQFVTYGLGLYNTRYGLLILPLIALGFGTLAGILNRFRLVVLVVLIVQLTVLFSSIPITLKDALYVFTSSRGIEQQKLAVWIRANQAGGLTLISALSNNSLVFDARLPLKHVISEGSGKYWQQAKNNPDSIAQRIIVSTEERDSIWKVSQEKKNFFNNYTLVFSGESFRVYDLVSKNPDSQRQ